MIGRQGITPRGPEVLDILRRFGVPALSATFDTNQLDSHAKDRDGNISECRCSAPSRQRAI